jgi:hypothetical protein
MFSAPALGGNSMKRLLAVIALSAMGCWAADISGTWKATAQSEMGTLERTFVFKVEGNKLSGETTSEMLGKSIIEDGKIEGDQFTFRITVKFQDQEMKVSYKGKVVSKDEIRMSAEIPMMGQTIEWVARRAS